MRRVTTAASALSGLMLAVVPAVVLAQVAASPPVVMAEPGGVHGLVSDEAGAPVPGAMVTVLGPITAGAVTDERGGFELTALPSGPYLLRVHLPGYESPHGQRLDLSPGARVSSNIALRRVPAPTELSRPVVEAGLVVAPDAGVLGRLEALRAETRPSPDADAAEPDTTPHEDDDLVWYLRHLRRSILKDVVAVVDDEEEDDQRTGLWDRTVGTPIRMAGDVLAVPLSGQVNLLAASSFNDPAELFEGDSRSRGITYVAFGAPAGGDAHWTVRGALTDGDITSWVVAGAYQTRPDAPGRHRYDLRLSYATERYDGGNPEALRAVADGSRNAGVVSAYDTYRANRRVTVTYGGRYSHYDYLDGRNLISPRVEATIAASDRFRLTTLVARRALAPGAEEFAPPVDGVLMLPPQRTFSAAAPGGRLSAERTTHVDVGFERDIPGATITARAYRQEIADQLVTLFAAELPDRTSAELGHYFVSGAGDVGVTGWAGGFRTAIADRVTGSVEYAVSRADWSPGAQVEYLVLVSPSAGRSGREIVHDLHTRIETDVPETETRVVVLYRLSDGFSRSDAGESPTVDARFEVEVRQSLPFLDFSSARWEMLVGVRNFFRDPAAGQSVYDELLVVRPPKRIVGGLTLRF